MSMDAPTVSALDQYSGVLGSIADMTVAHFKTLTSGGLPVDAAAEMTGDLHDALLVLFASPTVTSDEDDE